MNRKARTVVRGISDDESPVIRGDRPSKIFIARSAPLAARVRNGRWTLLYCVSAATLLLLLDWFARELA